MRFSNTLLLALSAVAVQSAVVPTQETTTQAVTQAQPTPQLTAEAQCVINNNCNQDVSCIAKCYNVPAPTNDMVYKTNDCASKCPDPTFDSAGYLKCYNECVDNFYMGNNVGAAAPAGNTTPATTDNTANGTTNATTNDNANTNANANANTNATNANGNNAIAQNGQNGNTTNANGTQNGSTNNVNGNNQLKPSNTTNVIPNNNNNNNSSSSATSMTVSAFAIGAAVLALLF
jgi:hypothetical protein